MFTGLSRYKQAGIFYGLAFGLCLLVSLFIKSRVVLMVAMFTPLTAVALMMFVVTRDGYTKEGRRELGLRWKGFRYWWLAILLPVPILLFSYMVVWALGLGSIELPATSVDTFKLAIELTVGLVFGTILGAGEELGWRGYLQPRLMELGKNRALMLTGLLWGIWHLPVFLLTPFYHGEGNLLIILPLFMAATSFISVIFGYLRLKTDSVWPAAVMHGSWNNTWSILRSITVSSSVLATEYLAGESGVLTLFGVMLVAGIIMYLQANKTQTQSIAPVAGD